MRSVQFPEANAALAKDQPEYETLYAHIDTSDPTIPMTACLELDELEIAEILRTKRIWLTQLTFGSPFQPIRMSTTNPFNSEIPES